MECSDLGVEGNPSNLQQRQAENDPVPTADGVEDQIYNWIRPGEIGFGPKEPSGLTRSPPSRPISVDGLPGIPTPDADLDAPEGDDIGPVPEDLDFCEALFEKECPIPEDTMFEPARIDEFRSGLFGQSATRLLIDLHPLLFPGANVQVIRGRRDLAPVIDGYNDVWAKSEEIFGRKPQPSHTRGLRLSMLNDTQRFKLEIEPGETSLYAATENIFFPYLVGQVRGDLEPLDRADEEAVHCMSIALRGLVHLARMAGRAESVHRRILGFSILHDVHTVSIYGFYPVIEGERTSYCRRLIRQFPLWKESTKWTCYRFVYNIDEDFLPLHTARIVDWLDHVPDVPFLEPDEIVDLIYAHAEAELSVRDSWKGKQAWAEQELKKGRNEKISEE